MSKARGEIAAYYWPPVDGWFSISPKAVRNENSQQVIWMRKATWEELAVCATKDGEFFIPASVHILTNDVLRARVAKMEDR